MQPYGDTDLVLIPMFGRIVEKVDRFLLIWLLTTKR